MQPNDHEPQVFFPQALNGVSVHSYIVAGVS